MPHPDLISRARVWLDDDPDPETREELRRLVDDAERGAPDALNELAERFSGTLQFGTAGLRGELGAGPMRMNRAVVLRAAAGLAAYLTKQGHVGGTVVIGYDARHRSADFARDTADVMAGAGFRAALLPRPLPTPVLAFAVRHLDAVAGVEVTASHNPPRDNGYKVYLGAGSQIVPPADAEIATEIAAVRSVSGLTTSDRWETLGEDVVSAYLDRTGAVLTPTSPREVGVVYTPLHGVGRETLAAAFTRAGFPAPVVVPEQAEPDPDFPTVAFPNPEEPGAMDLAFATASTRPHGSVDLVIANDPDADRCAVAVPEPGASVLPGGLASDAPAGDQRAPGGSGASGGSDAAGTDAAVGWRMLRGDEVGALLATHLVHKATRGTFATSIVSSSLLSRIAAAAGVAYTETLTGFKWLARVDGVAYAYEEALGYCVDPGGVLDKDGITAALLIAELTAELKQQGRTLTDLLDDIALEHGLHATDQLSVRVDDLSVISGAMARLRDQPPTELAGLTVRSAEDLSRGTAELPATDGLRYQLAGLPAPSVPSVADVRSARVIVRPSGTEPKLKCYLEVVLDVPGADALPRSRETAKTLLAALSKDVATAMGL